MSLHKQFASKAIKSGKKSCDFHEAAQSHANSAFFYLIISVAFWYFFGWSWASVPIFLCLFSTVKSIFSTLVEVEIENYEPAPSELESIVQAYGDILGSGAPAPGCVADTSKLPYPKETIKAALIMALKLTEDPQTKGHLKGGYLDLSNWQEGVGDIDQGFNVSALDKNIDPQSMAEIIVEQTTSSEKWTTMAQKEYETLLQELSVFLGESGE